MVIALDDSEYAEIVLEHALDQAVRHGDVDLHFVTVVSSRANVDAAKAWLARLVFDGLENVKQTDWRSRLHVRIGTPAMEIAELAGELDTDLLVLGRFGLHDRRTSLSDRVLARVSCPTLVVALGAHVVEVEACRKCAVVREESDGERWFCDEHSSPDRLDLTTRLPSSTTSVGGGLLW